MLSGLVFLEGSSKTLLSCERCKRELFVRVEYDCSSREMATCFGSILKKAKTLKSVFNKQWGPETSYMLHLPRTR